MMFFVTTNFFLVNHHLVIDQRLFLTKKKKKIHFDKFCKLAKISCHKNYVYRAICKLCRGWNSLRACLHGGGGPQIGEETHSGG